MNSRHTCEKHCKPPLKNNCENFILSQVWMLSGGLVKLGLYYVGKRP